MPERRSTTYMKVTTDYFKKRNVRITDIGDASMKRERVVQIADDIVMKFLDTQRSSIQAKVYVERALEMSIYGQYVVFKCMCLENGRVGIGISSTFVQDREAQKLKYIFGLSNSELLMSCDEIALDVKLYGLGAFDVQVLGYFSSMVGAMAYKGYMLNTLLDEGKSCYDNDIHTGKVKRFVITVLDYRLVSVVSSWCRSNNMNVPSLIRGLLKSFFKKKSGKG